jgi:phage terminase Nu1 subunit (DNA packaging protein)
MSEPRHEDAWVTRADLARVFDCSVTAFDKYIRPHAAPDHQRKQGKTLYFYARGVIESWALRHRAAVHDDLLQSTADSPALERYREERAKLAKLDRLQREHELVRTSDLTANLTLLGTILRIASETVRREFGDGAGAILDGALGDFDKQVETLARQPDETQEGKTP